jgi:hypothetical protein
MAHCVLNKQSSVIQIGAGSSFHSTQHLHLPPGKHQVSVLPFGDLLTASSVTCQPHAGPSPRKSGSCREMQQNSPAFCASEGARRICLSSPISALLCLPNVHWPPQLNTPGHLCGDSSDLLSWKTFFCHSTWDFWDSAFFCVSSNNYRNKLCDQVIYMSPATQCSYSEPPSHLILIYKTKIPLALNQPRARQWTMKDNPFVPRLTGLIQMACLELITLSWLSHGKPNQGSGLCLAFCLLIDTGTSPHGPEWHVVALHLRKCTQ